MGIIVMTIESLLGSLQKVKRTGPGKWMASCPCHEDRTPSLAIKDDNGTILLHCFSQECAPADICAAVGIAVSDLFPLSENYDASQPKPKKQTGFEPDQVLFAVVMEIVAAQLIVDEVLKTMPDSELKNRLDLASKRIHSAWLYAKKYG